MSWCTDVRPSARPVAGPPAGGLFAEDFDQTNAPPAAAPAEPVFAAADLEAARDDAYAEGRAAGRLEAEAGLQAEADAVLAALAAARAGALEAAEASAEALARLLLGTLAAMLPALCERHAATEIAAVARAMLPGLLAEPSITVRASPRVLPALEHEISRMDPAHAARLVLIPADAMDAGAVQIGWAEGSAVRDPQAIWLGVAAALRQAGLLDADQPPGAETPKRELAHVE